MMRGKERLSIAVRTFVPPPPSSPPPVPKGTGNGNLEDTSKEDEKGEGGKGVPRGWKAEERKRSVISAKGDGCRKECSMRRFLRKVHDKSNLVGPCKAI